MQTVKMFLLRILQIIPVNTPLQLSIVDLTAQAARITKAAVQSHLQLLFIKALEEVLAAEVAAAAVAAVYQQPTRLSLIQMAAAALQAKA